jgi:PAS domain-containing protein
MIEVDEHMLPLFFLSGLPRLERIALEHTDMQHRPDNPPNDTQDTIRFHGCGQALDSLGDPLLMLDREFKIISANGAFKRWLLTS